MEQDLSIEISGLPDETARVILALAAQRDISPNQAAIELINFAAGQTEWKPSVSELPAMPVLPNHFPN